MEELARERRQVLISDGDMHRILNVPYGVRLGDINIINPARAQYTNEQALSDDPRPTWLITYIIIPEKRS